MSYGHDHHEHGHDHLNASGGHVASAEMTARVNQLVEQLEQRGITSNAELGALIDGFLAKAGPSNGAQLVARAWTDDAFRSLLTTDAAAAITAAGIETSNWADVTLRVIPNTEHVHNVIVCTLCSCYPLALLGTPPTWYKSDAYRARVVREPRAVLAEFGTTLPVDTEIRVWDSTAELRYMVLPLQPIGTEHMNAAELASLVPRDALIGVVLPTVSPAG